MHFIGFYKIMILITNITDKNLLLILNNSVSDVGDAWDYM